MCHVMKVYSSVEVSVHAILTPTVHDGEWSASRSGGFSLLLFLLASSQATPFATNLGIRNNFL
jgi:hypothetical protein